MEIFWVILNVVLFLFLIFIIFRIFKVVKLKYGILAAILFVILVLGGLSTGRTPEKKPLQGNCTIVEEIPVNPLQDLRLYVATDQVGKCTGYMTCLTGWMIGLGFTEGVVSLSEMPGVYQYSISGTQDWKLLGITVWRTAKEFKGEVSVKSV